MPLTLGVIFLTLLLLCSGWRPALLAMLGVPFACLGAILALRVRGMAIDTSTAVGFCALFGVATLAPVLMIRGINASRRKYPLPEAIVHGVAHSLRPILVTASVAIVGLLPASLATGVGSDVQRPLATVVVWGLVSSLTLTLFALPAFYALLPPAVMETGAADE